MISPFFKKLIPFLEKEVAPVAHQLDEDADLFRKIHERFVDLGSLNFLIPSALGGLGGERNDWIEYNILMAQYSGALLFLQAQHQYSVSRLKKLLDFFQTSTSDANYGVAPVLKASHMSICSDFCAPWTPCTSSTEARFEKSLLPDARVDKTLHWLATSKQGIGLALAKNKNLFEVKSTEDAYLISGTLPWVTGFDYFSHLLFSFEHDGMLFYTLLPFKAAKCDAGDLLISPKIETAVFNSINSNSVTLKEWLIRHDDIIFSHAITPKKPIEHPSVYNLAGAAKALLNEALQGKYGSLPEVKKTHILLSRTWNEYYQRILENKTCPLTLRAEGVQLAERCVIFSPNISY